METYKWKQVQLYMSTHEWNEKIFLWGKEVFVTYRITQWYWQLDHSILRMFRLGYILGFIAILVIRLPNIPSNSYKIYSDGQTLDQIKLNQDNKTLCHLSQTFTYFQRVSLSTFVFAKPFTKKGWMITNTNAGAAGHLWTRLMKYHLSWNQFKLKRDKKHITI